MSVDIRRPSERTCVDCGRAEHWDEETENWVVADDDVGNRFCIHDWDITGQFTPVDR